MKKASLFLLAATFSLLGFGLTGAHAGLSHERFTPFTLPVEDFAGGGSDAAAEVVETGVGVAEPEVELTSAARPQKCLGTCKRRTPKTTNVHQRATSVAGTHRPLREAASNANYRPGFLGALVRVIGPH